MNRGEGRKGGEEKPTGGGGCSPKTPQPPPAWVWFLLSFNLLLNCSSAPPFPASTVRRFSHDLIGGGWCPQPHRHSLREDDSVSVAKFSANVYLSLFSARYTLDTRNIVVSRLHRTPVLTELMVCEARTSNNCEIGHLPRVAGSAYLIHRCIMKARNCTWHVIGTQ